MNVEKPGVVWIDGDGTVYRAFLNSARGHADESERHLALVRVVAGTMVWNTANEHLYFGGINGN